MCSCGTYSAAISLSCLKNFYCQANPQVKVTPGPKAEWLQIIVLRPPRYCRAFEGFHGILWEKWVAHKAASSAWKGARVEFALSAATRSFDSGSEGKISLACLPSLTFRWSSLLPTHSGPQILRLLPSRVTQQHSSLSLASHDHTGQLRTGFPAWITANHGSQRQLRPSYAAVDAESGPGGPMDGPFRLRRS